MRLRRAGRGRVWARRPAARNGWPRYGSRAERNWSGGGRSLAAILTIAALTWTSACNESTGVEKANAEQAAPPSAPARKAAVIAIKNVGSKPIRPDAEITATATNGTLTKVVITDGDGASYRGQLSLDSTSWHFDGGLAPGGSYTLVAKALGTDGKVRTARRAFKTQEAASTISASISPTDGATVGVGQPITIEFSGPVEDRAAVEERLRVTSSKPVAGAWHWISDTEVRYRPKVYWPAYTKVTVTAGLTGVEASRDVWGISAEIGEFEIGRSMVSLVDLEKHTMKVYEDGKLLRTIPVTGGKPGYISRSGVKVVIGKVFYTIMDGTSIGIPKDDPEYYRFDVYYAVKVTESGEYVHAAPWSTWAQGNTNVSHGCIGMSTENGRWFYDRAILGDIVKTIGTDKPMELNNGFGDWNLSWSEWLAGSALNHSGATSTRAPHSFAPAGP